jgi:hypothetical protein
MIHFSTEALRRDVVDVCDPAATSQSARVAAASIPDPSHAVDPGLDPDSGMDLKQRAVGPASRE